MITKEMIENFIGSDQKPIDYLVEIANNKYAIETFKLDVINYNKEIPQKDWVKGYNKWKKTNE